MTVTGSVSKWFEDTFTMCRQYHIVPVMWETGQFFDRSNGNLKFRDLGEFWNATNVNAEGVYASGNTDIKNVTGKIDVSKVVTDIPSTSPVWSWEGMVEILPLVQTVTVQILQQVLKQKILYLYQNAFLQQTEILQRFSLMRQDTRCLSSWIIQSIQILTQQ